MLQPAASTSEPEGSGQLSGDVLDIDISVDAFELPSHANTARHLTCSAGHAQAHEVQGAGGKQRGQTGAGEQASITSHLLLQVAYVRVGGQNELEVSRRLEVEAESGAAASNMQIDARARMRSRAAPRQYADLSGTVGASCPRGERSEAYSSSCGTS